MRGHSKVAVRLPGGAQHGKPSGSWLLTVLHTCKPAEVGTEHALYSKVKEIPLQSKEERQSADIRPTFVL